MLHKSATFFLASQARLLSGPWSSPDEVAQWSEWFAVLRSVVGSIENGHGWGFSAVKGVCQDATVIYTGPETAPSVAWCTLSGLSQGSAVVDEL